MKLYLYMVLAFIVLIFGVPIVGALLRATVFRKPLLKKSIESYLLCQFYGTGFILLVFGWSTYLGLIAPQASTVVAISIVLLVLVVWFRGNLKNFYPLRSSKHFLFLTLLFVGSAGFYFLPLLSKGGYDFCNDTYAYVTISEWLQEHPFSKKFQYDPSSLYYLPVEAYQNAHLRMGGIFFLAFWQSLFPMLRSHELFPVVMGWAVALNGAGIYLMCRQIFRLPRVYGLYACWGSFAFLGPFFASAQWGFYPQLLGTAFASAFLASVARVHSSYRWNFSNSFQVAFFIVGVTACYSELAPFVGVICIQYVVCQAILSWKKQQLYSFSWMVVQTLTLVLLLGNIECYRAVKAILFQAGVVVGWHVPFDTVGFLAFALGFPIWHADNLSSHGLLISYCLLPVVTAFLLLGVYKYASRLRHWEIFCYLGLMAAFGVYFLIFVKDPWTGEYGHSWSLLKLCKWSFPCIAVVIWSGIYIASRSIYLSPKIIGIILCTAILIVFPRHLRVAKDYAEKNHTWLTKENSLLAIREIDNALQKEAAGKQLFLLKDLHNAWPSCYYSFLFKEFKFLNQWRSPWNFFYDEPKNIVGYKEDVLLLVPCQLPFEESDKKLPAGWSLVNTDRAFVFEVSRQWYSYQYNGESNSPIYLDHPSIKIWVFAPSVGYYDLTLRFKTKTSDGSYICFKDDSLPLKIENPHNPLRFIRSEGEESVWNYRVHLQPNASYVVVNPVETSKYSQGEVSIELTDAKLVPVQEIANSSTETNLK
ncbi:Hypothetical protein PBC10988_7230 [Planctomycetales bacterium 10988]|nr:Hypothetical protein PBC10988_7230 [Planctomycetales bacterium 10988]